MRYLDCAAGRREFAGLRVNLEDGYVVSALVCGHNVVTVGRNTEVARRFATAASLPGRGQLASLLIDGERGDAVVPAVGTVQETATRMHQDLRR